MNVFSIAISSKPQVYIDHIAAVSMMIIDNLCHVHSKYKIYRSSACIVCVLQKSDKVSNKVSDKPPVRNNQVDIQV